MDNEFYLAAKDGSGVQVKTIEEMEEFLAKGWSIFKTEDDKESIIATPEDGWIDGKPEINGPKICRSVSQDAVRALNIILTGEDNG